MKKLEVYYLDTTNFSKQLQDMVLEVRSLPFSEESVEVFTLKLLMSVLIWSAKLKEICHKTVPKIPLLLLITSETTSVMSLV